MLFLATWLWFGEDVITESWPVLWLVVVFVDFGTDLMPARFGVHFNNYGDGLF